MRAARGVPQRAGLPTPRALPNPPDLRDPPAADEDTDRRYKLVGLLILTVFPTGFWVLVIALVSNAIGMPIGTNALILCALGIAAMCALGAALLIGNR